MKHGSEGGECRRWTLNDHDYINQIEYAYDKQYGNLTGVMFLTELGEMRSVGQWTTGRRVIYQYNEEKKFIGFMSFELLDKTYAFGAYDSVCNHLEPGEVPIISSNLQLLGETNPANLESNTHVQTIWQVGLLIILLLEGLLIFRNRNKTLADEKDDFIR